MLGYIVWGGTLIGTFYLEHTWLLSRESVQEVLCVQLLCSISLILDVSLPKLGSADHLALTLEYASRLTITRQTIFTLLSMICGRKMCLKLRSVNISTRCVRKPIIGTPTPSQGLIDSIGGAIKL